MWLLISTYINLKLSSLGISDETNTYYKTSQVDIEKEDIIRITDVIDVEWKTRKSRVSIPFTLYVGENVEYYKDLKIFLDEKEATKKGTILYDSIRLDTKNLSLGKHKIIITYSIDTKDVVQEYNNASILKISKNNMFEKLNININFPNETERVKLSEKHKIEKISNKKYHLDINEEQNVLISKREDFDLIIDSGVIKETKKIKGNYNINSIQNKKQKS